MNRETQKALILQRYVLIPGSSARAVVFRKVRIGRSSNALILLIIMAVHKTRTFFKSPQLSENRGKERQKPAQLGVFEGEGSAQLLPQNRGNPAVPAGGRGGREITQGSSWRRERNPDGTFSVSVAERTESILIPVRFAGNKILIRNDCHLSHNLKVVGSNPTPATKLARNLKWLRAF